MFSLSALCSLPRTHTPHVSLPQTNPDFWAQWNAFEIETGSEDTFREVSLPFRHEILLSLTRTHPSSLHSTFVSNELSKPRSTRKLLTSLRNYNKFNEDKPKRKKRSMEESMSILWPHSIVLLVLQSEDSFLLPVVKRLEETVRKRKRNNNRATRMRSISRMTMTMTSSSIDGMGTKVEETRSNVTPPSFFGQFPQIRIETRGNGESVL